MTMNHIHPACNGYACLASTVAGCIHRSWTYACDRVYLNCGLRIQGLNDLQGVGSLVCMYTKQTVITCSVHCACSTTVFLTVTLTLVCDVLQM